MGEIIHLEEYIEQKELDPTKQQIYRRLGQIGVEISLLEMEQARLENML